MARMQAALQLLLPKIGSVEPNSIYRGGSAHVFESLPSGAGPTVRTYVPQGKRFHAHAARARGALALPLVPHARGRRRCRLGGRLDRACGVRRAPSPTSAARAERLEAHAAPARRALAGRAHLRLAHAGRCALRVRRNRAPAAPSPPGAPPLIGPFASTTPTDAASRPEGRLASSATKPAASYSPRPFRAKYHRR